MRKKNRERVHKDTKEFNKDPKRLKKRGNVVDKQSKVLTRTDTDTAILMAKVETANLELEKLQEKLKQQIAESKKAEDDLRKHIAEKEALSDRLRQVMNEMQEKDQRLQKNADELELQAWGLSKTNEAIKLLYNELERKNKELQKLDQMKSAFVSTVSHELRTPLSITKEGITLVLEGITGGLNETQKKILNTAKGNIDRLARIINALLDISKIEAGMIELKRTFVDIRKMVKDICSVWHLESDKRKQILQVSVPEAAVNIYVDADKITQVLNNLISNAIKYTPEKGNINVELKDHESRVEIIVSDSGLGISKENLPKVFGKFQQFSRTVGPGLKGTGLGLAISKELVQLHKGSMKVESEIDKGTTFAFSLPKVEEMTVFKEGFDSKIKEAGERRIPLCLLVMYIPELCRFDSAQDSDKDHNMLREIGKEIRKTLPRQTDATVVRDRRHLIVSLFDTKKEDVVFISDRIKKVISDYLFKNREKEGRGGDIGIGYTAYPEDGVTAEELLSKAKAMINAKGGA